MGWVFLEVLIVLAIAVGIVWWTVPKAPKAGAEGAKVDDANDPGQRKGGDTEPNEAHDRT